MVFMFEASQPAPLETLASLTGPATVESSRSNGHGQQHGAAAMSENEFILMFVLLMLAVWLCIKAVGKLRRK